MNSHELLNHITLIIPTFNRTNHLTRLLKYYALKKTSIRFLILDSSNKLAKSKNEEATLVLKSQIRYVHFPTATPVATKLFEGLKLADTAYCTFCADDDLVFINGLIAALSFLQAHPDYVCVDGIYLNFHHIENNVHLNIEYASKGIHANDPGARIFNLYQKYESLFYGVFRTIDAQQIFSSVSKHTSLHYQELFQASAALLIGKSHRLPQFYAARQNCQAADTQRDKWQTYYWFAENPQEFLQHYLQYRRELWLFYQKFVAEKSYHQNDFFRVIDIAHAMYFGLGCPPDYFISVLQKQWPNDLLQKFNPLTDDVCSELKGYFRIWLENFIDQSIIYLPKLLLSFYSFRKMHQLNKKIRRQSKNQWNCIPARDFRWLVSVDRFHQAYQELCFYLDQGDH